MKFLFILLNGILFALLISCNNPKQNPKRNIISKQDKLNVVFIIADDLNCDLGIYGNEIVKTPNIDKLSQKSVVFKNAHCQYPLCGPSRASFMTGMYTNQTKITNNNVLIRSTVPEVVTLGQRFRQQGYQSVRVGKIFHYDNPGTIGTSGMDDIYSWDQTINPYGRDKVEEYKIKTLSPRSYGGTLSWMEAEGKDEEQTDGIGASEAINQLEQFSKSGDNFFLAVGFYRPHTPFVAPKNYFNLYNREEIPIPYSSPNYLTTIPESAAKSIRAKKNQINLDEALAKEIKQAYYASISFVDAQVGRILNSLRKTGLDKNTIIVFTSDHGYHLGEHGHWQKQTLFENATKVPLIITAPNMENELIINSSPVELIDIYPTLMELTKIKAPSHVVGKSLCPILQKETDSVRNNVLTRWRNGYSLKTSRYRITQWREEDNLGYELYDHKLDENELKNLAEKAEYKVILDSLTATLKQRILDAGVKPDGLGIQIENVQPMLRQKSITPGDIYDEKSKRTYLKTSEPIKK
jgi:arylsulfatase A-like enzyme